MNFSFHYLACAEPVEKVEDNLLTKSLVLLFILLFKGVEDAESSADSEDGSLDDELIFLEEDSAFESHLFELVVLEVIAEESLSEQHFSSL